jgi:hypothetical protein
VNLLKKILFLFSVYSFQCSAQSLLFPTEYFFDIYRQKQAFTDTNKNYPVHVSMQPFEYAPAEKNDSLQYYKEGRKLFARKVFYESLVKINYRDKSADDAQFKLTIDPVFNFQQGMDRSDASHKKIYTNQRGFWVRGSINDKLKIESAFFENQSTFASYADAYVQANKIVPGQGRWKPFKSNGYDYAFSSGVISYTPCKNFNVQLGHGKQKVGNGYRSLLLSDNSFNYPFARITSKFFKGKLQYTNIYALLMNLNGGGAKSATGTEAFYQKKAMAIQQVSWQVHKRVNLSFYQGMIWGASDSMNKQHINIAYLNPIIYTNTAAYGLHNKNNILIGGDIQIKLFKSIALYGQWMIDNIDSIKLKNSDAGIQAGLKYFDAFTLKNLFLQAEVNSINRSPYSSSYASQRYDHYGQNLAYPLAAYNGKEVVLIAAYKYKRLVVNGKINLFQTDNNSAKQNLVYGDFKIAYLINPATNMNLSAGINYRNFKQTSLGLTGTPSTATLQNQIFYISLKTSLYNTYWDF